MAIDVTARARDPLAGTHYRVVRSLATGGVSEVFEALGPGGEPRAVKVLRGMYTDSREAVFRLLQEGRILSALRHPSLAPLLEIGVTRDGRPFLIMPYLEGATLRQRLDRRGPLPYALACEMFAEALDALHLAHRHDIVHRDLKPSNLLLAPSLERPARALVLDFGIAKVAGAHGHHTTDSKILGTPRYLAPEQILGGEVDARTDVHAMGLVLFEAIAGKSPFDVPDDADPMVHMSAHLEEPPRRLSDLMDVPPSLDAALARALEKKPARRFPSAAAFAAALRRATREAEAVALAG